MASDSDTAVGDLEWSKSGGVDADEFALSAGGVLAFVAAKDFEDPDDADGDGRYEVTVQVSDGTSADTADLVVTVENVIELTAVTGESEVTFFENTATRVATFAASSDEDRHGVEWILAGADAEHFSVDSPPGALRFDIDAVTPRIFAEPPDFEDPVDSDTGNDYELSLRARVGASISAAFSVTVTVSDADDSGAVSLSTARPTAGTAVTATLSDPDGVTAGTATWRWERSTGPNGWAVIDGAGSAVYTPAAADTATMLRVSATYDDEHGTGHRVEAVAPNVVLGPLLTALSASTGDSAANSSRELFPAFDDETLHYGIGCEADDTMTLSLSAPATARVAVDGTQVAGTTAAVEVAVGVSSDVSIAVTDTGGAGTVYVIHCLAELFFDYETTIEPDTDGVFEDLLLFAHRSNLVVMDHNGVARFHRHVPGLRSRVWLSRVGDDGDYRYSYASAVPVPEGSLIRFTSEMTVLDEHFRVIAESVTSVSPVTPAGATDHHDFEILPNGNYLLMIYDPASRDITQLPFVDPERMSPIDMVDSAIQIVTPSGQSVFHWNSWDHMALDDCVQHRSPFMGTNRDYAHINSLQLVDGVIVGSFRGCSKVLGIDEDTGAVLWRLGRSNLSDEQWAARGIGPAPLSTINDPLGEFCGQHAASILPNGNLLLYDNGVVCVIDPVTSDQLGRAGNDYSRAVEYALDFDNNEAIYVREHSMHGDKRRYAWSSGSVQLLDGGDWLISWGRPLDGPVAFDHTVTQVDPSTGQEKFAIRFTDAYKVENSRATIQAVAVPAEALAPQQGTLTGDFPASAHTSVFHSGAGDSPAVVVAFSRPVVDFDATTPSVSVTGATVASVAPLVVSGEAANAYLVTLTPDGDGAITFELVADQGCGSGGICAADGTELTGVPPALVVGPGEVTFERAAYSVAEGAAVAVEVCVGAAHRGVRAVTVPVAVDALSASSDDFTAERAVTFAAGERCKTVTVEASHDDLVEGPETLTLNFGVLSDGVSAGSVDESTVTIGDADRARISYTAQPVQVAEGGDGFLVFEITGGVTFQRDQAISLTVGGTATPTDDFVVLDGLGYALSVPYTVVLRAGAASVAVSVFAVDDTVVEATAETVVVGARLEFTGASLGTRTLTIPPSDVPDLPQVSIRPGSAVTEGDNAVFTLSRTDASSAPLSGALTVQVSVTATETTLRGPTPGSVTFEAGAATAAVAIATLDDTIVEDPGEVTVLVLGSTANPPTYLTTADNAATVTVFDNDMAAFNVSAGSSEVNEGASVSVVVETVDITFAEPQTLELALSGTATPVDDFTLTDARGQDLTSSPRLVLPAGSRSARFTIRAATDSEEDPGETIAVSVAHESYSIGEVTVTITENVQPRVITGVITAGGGGDDTPVATAGIEGAAHSAAGREAVFTAAVDNGRIGSVAWTVTGPDGFPATRSTPRLVFTAPAGGTYTITATVVTTARQTLTASVSLAVFGDVGGHQFVDEIVWLAETGTTRGCSQQPLLYCPDKPVTRAEMASLLARALGLQAPSQPAGFDDVDPDGVHAGSIEALHEAQITTGCAQQPLRYCPDKPVTRAQMAAFLYRARDLISAARAATDT